MQTVSATALDAVTGSHRLFVRADAWYGGQIVAADMPITDGHIEGSDDGNAIRHRLSLTVADPDGTLVPRSEDAALAPYGSEVNVRAGVYIGGEAETCSLGWFPLQTSQASESWRIYQRVDGPVWSSSGGTVAVSGVDRGVWVQNAKFMAPEQPTEATIRTEVIRLLEGLLRIGNWPGVTDISMPATVTYSSDDRWGAVCDLAARVEAIPYLDPFGDLVLRPVTAGASVWTVPVGEDGILIDASTDLDATGVYNGVIASGSSGAQVPVQRIRLLGSGPLRWDGPFKRKPLKFDSPLITDDTEADLTTYAQLNRATTRRSFPLAVTCVANYWLQVGDTVTLGTPLGEVSGRVTSARWPLTPGPMTMTVSVPRDELWAAYQ